MKKVLSILLLLISSKYGLTQYKKQILPNEDLVYSLLKDFTTDLNTQYVIDISLENKKFRGTDLDSCLNNSFLDDKYRKENYNQYENKMIFDSIDFTYMNYQLKEFNVKQTLDSTLLKKFGITYIDYRHQRIKPNKQVLKINIPLLSIDHSKALISSHNNHSGFIYILIKQKNEKWKIIKSRLIWIS